jgi:hydroxyacylglutathione hydrolase
MIQYRDSHVTVFRSALYLVNSIVVQTDDIVLIVDPAYLPHEIDEIRMYVDSIAGDKPLYILFTHSDLDHISGYGWFPDAISIASEKFVLHPNPDAAVNKVKANDDELYVLRPDPIQYPKIKHVISQEGQQLTVGSTTLTFYMAPGHHRDGMFIIIESLGLFILGDYLSDVEFPFVYHSFQDYLVTLEKAEQICRQHSIRFLVPGHGTICDIETAMKRKEESETYLSILMKERTSAEKTDIDAILARFGYNFRNCMAKWHAKNLIVLENEF